MRQQHCIQPKANLLPFIPHCIVSQTINTVSKPATLYPPLLCAPNTPGTIGGRGGSIIPRAAVAASLGTNNRAGAAAAAAAAATAVGPAASGGATLQLGEIVAEHHRRHGTEIEAVTDEDSSCIGYQGSTDTLKSDDRSRLDGHAEKLRPE